MALLKANTGIGITNPSEALHVIGNGLFEGIVSATSFIGNLSGTATSAINLVGGEQGSVPYQSSTNSTTFLSPGTPGQVLITGGGGENPYWAPVSAASGSFSGITIRDEGNVVGSASSISSLNFVGANITATGSGIAATITIANNLVGTALSISGISTFTNGPVLIGSGTSTGTTAQPLQVSGGAYVSGNLGIGTTRPTSALQVQGNLLVSGVSTIGTIRISSGIVTASSGIVTYYGDGSKLTNVTPPLTVKEVAGNPIGIGTTVLSISNVNTILFDRDTGFNVTNNGNGEVFVDLGSTFAVWFVPGSNDLRATGEDTVEFIAGPGIAITTKSTSTGVGTGLSKSITFTDINWIKTSVGIHTFTNVGIGTTNPTSKLQVQGDVSIASTVGIGTVIDIVPYDTLNSGTLSFEGSAGQLFSITNNLTSGSIFSVNDVSGIPSIDVDANGTVSLVAYGGNVAIGSTGLTGTSAQRLQVTGGAYVSGNLGIGTTNPSQSLHIQGNARLTGALYDGSNVAGTSGQILSSTGSAISWINASTTNVGSANSIAIAADSTNASRHLTFVSTTSGNNVVYVDSDLLYNPSTNSLAINNTSFTGTASQNLQVTGGAYVSGNLGIGTTNPQYKLQVVGDFAATTKSFVIPHPTEPGMKLRYGSLESPYHGIRLTGSSIIQNGSCIVNLPNYIHNFVKEEGVHINITNIKHGKVLWVEEVDIQKNKFIVMTEENVGEYEFYWDFTAIRNDIDEMIVEY